MYFVTFYDYVYDYCKLQTLDYFIIKVFHEAAMEIEYFLGYLFISFVSFV